MVTATSTATSTDMRTSFADAATRLLDDDPLAAVVLADISSDRFVDAARRHPHRVINVGIREPLMVSVAGGLALSGMRPIAHSYAPFLIERSFEQVKLDLSHQGVNAVLVSVGASYDTSESGRTHHSPGDVALVDTLPGWSIHVPGHPAEVPALLTEAVGQDHPSYIRLAGRGNRAPRPASGTGKLDLVRSGGSTLVVAVGPLLDAVLEATAGLDVSVAYAATVRPFDSAGLRTLAGTDVVLVEPYLAGTSARVVDEALADRAHRTLSLGVDRVELRRYGTPADHDAAYGLDPVGLRRSITRFVGER
jgi:transketolase